jgi:hypothetical protein
MSNAENINRMIAALSRLGITASDAEALRRISRTMNKWSEQECNGFIQRDEATGLPRGWYEDSRGVKYEGGIIPDREAKAQKQLRAIMAHYPKLWAYEQGDPRGCSLYVGSRDDLPAGAKISTCYSSFGIGVY